MCMQSFLCSQFHKVHTIISGCNTRIHPSYLTSMRAYTHAHTHTPDHPFPPRQTLALSHWKGPYRQHTHACLLAVWLIFRTLFPLRRGSAFVRALAHWKASTHIVFRPHFWLAARGSSISRCGSRPPNGCANALSLSDLARAPSTPTPAHKHTNTINASVSRRARHTRHLHQHRLVLSVETPAARHPRTSFLRVCVTRTREREIRATRITTPSSTSYIR